MQYLSTKQHKLLLPHENKKSFSDQIIYMYVYKMFVNKKIDKLMKYKIDLDKSSPFELRKC